MPLSHKTPEALTDPSASKTFHEQLIISTLGHPTGINVTIQLFAFLALKYHHLPEKFACACVKR
jgi:hypothetical protein